MIMYRQPDGKGCPYLLIEQYELSKIIQVETAKFYKENPEQFENLEKAKEFAPLRFARLSNIICKRIAEEKLNQ